jgi:N-acetylmuramoyl-L-alanine amidase
MKIVDHRLHRDDGTPYPFRDTPNKSGSFRPRWLVMHYTAGGSAQESIGWLARSDAKASAHVVIDKKGGITQMVRFDQRAWHAGESRWKGVEGLNGHSFGIELDGFGEVFGGPGKWRFRSTSVPDADVLVAAHRNEPGRQRGWAKYPPAQLAAALELARLLVRTYGLEDVIGHDDISPGRKWDPGPAFDMAGFRAAALGAAPPPRDAPAPPAPGTGARMRVSASSLNLRAGAGAGNPTVAGSPLPRGTVVEALESAGEWRRVRVQGAVNGAASPAGWVHGGFLEPLSAPLFTVTASALNVRGGPATTFAPVAGSPLPRDTVVEELEESAGWKRVRAGDARGTTGWVSGAHLAPAVIPVGGVGQPTGT